MEQGFPDFGQMNNEAVLAILECFGRILWGEPRVIDAANRVNCKEIIARLKDTVEGDNEKFVARCIEGMLTA